MDPDPDNEDADETDATLEALEEDEELEAGPTAADQVTFAEFLSALVNRASVYRALITASSGSAAIDRRLRNLRLIKAQPSYGFLMALRSGGTDDKTFDEVLRLTEVLLLRRHTTRERTGENETIFAELCKVDPKAPLAPTRKAYADRCPSDASFRAEFEATQFPSNLIERARYCLEQFEIERQGGRHELLPAGPQDVHVEHVIPKKIKSKKAKREQGDWVEYLGDKSLALHKRYVGRIGNLTLLAGDLNLTASNNPYERKVGCYKRSAFKITSTIPDDYAEFNLKTVEQRSAELAAKALEIWPEIS